MSEFETLILKDLPSLQWLISISESKVEKIYFTTNILFYKFNGIVNMYTIRYNKIKSS